MSKNSPSSYVNSKFSRDGIQEKKSNADETWSEMESEGTRSLGLVFTHELHPDTGVKEKTSIPG